MTDNDTIKNTVEEVELTEEENKGQLRTYEDNILEGLLAAATYQDDEETVYPVEIIRNKVKLFSFRVRPLSEEDYQKCKEKHTKYVRNKQLGIRYPEETNTIKYRSHLIYLATVPEDRKNIWDNKEAWRQLNVITGIDLIDKVLMAGEKDAVLEYIDKISGYSQTAEETAKN